MFKITFVRVTNKTMLISKLWLVFKGFRLFLRILNRVLKCVLNWRFIDNWRAHYILTSPVLVYFVNWVIVLVIVYNFSNQLLQWVKPHSENCAHFGKTVDVTRIVISTHVANIWHERFCKVIAIHIEWIIQFTGPIVTKIISYTVYFLQVEVCTANRYRLF